MGKCTSITVKAYTTQQPTQLHQSLKSGFKDFAEPRTDDIMKYAKFSVHPKLGNQTNLAANNRFHISYSLHICMYKGY